MTSLTVVRRNGVVVSVEAEDGEVLMHVVRLATGGEVLGMCGGSCACATCHVLIDADWIDRVGRAEGDECELLAGSPAWADNSRLACQIRVRPELNGLRLTVAPE